MQASFQGPWIKWAQVSDDYKKQWFAAFKVIFKNSPTTLDLQNLKYVNIIVIMLS